jgi:hypothetical protein
VRTPSIGFNVFLAVSTSAVALLAASSLRGPARASSPPPLLAAGPGATVAVITRTASGGPQVASVIGDMVVEGLRDAGVRAVQWNGAYLPIARQIAVQSQAAAPDTEPGLQSPEIASGLEHSRATAVAPAQFSAVLNVTVTEFRVINHGAGAVIFGPFARIGLRSNIARVALEYRLNDARTGDTLVNGSVSGEKTGYGGASGSRRGRFAATVGLVDLRSPGWPHSLVGEACGSAVRDLVGRLAGKNRRMRGQVLAVTADGNAVVTIGGMRLKPGDRLSILKISRVTDQDGAVVWSDEKPVGEVRVLEVHGDRAKVAPLTPGVELNEGDYLAPGTARPGR